MKAVKLEKRPNPHGPLKSRVHTMIPNRPGMGTGGEFELRKVVGVPGTLYRVTPTGIRRVDPKPNKRSVNKS